MKASNIGDIIFNISNGESDLNLGRVVLEQLEKRGPSRLAKQLIYQTESRELYTYILPLRNYCGLS